MVVAVGSQTFNELHEVPWDKLGPGDNVLVAWRPEPYRSKIQLAGRGTADSNISIVGLRGPTGQLPIVDGAKATEWPDAKYFYSGVAGQGVFTMCPRGDEGPDYKPGYYTIRNLDIRHTGRHVKYTDFTGNERTYGTACAGVTMYRSEYVTIQGCLIHDHENGIFGKSDLSEQSMLRGVRIVGNRIWDNGRANRNHYHNSYLEVADLIYEYNWFGPTKAGSGGTGIKDRGAGLIVRYNEIVGGSYNLDLVEPDSSGDLMMAQPDAMVRKVYGNLIVKDPASRTPILTGWDQVGEWDGGKLFLYDNTIVLLGDHDTLYYCCTLKVMPGAYAECRNNLFHTMPAPGSSDPGTFYFDVSDYGSGGSWINLAGGNWFSSAIQRVTDSSKVERVDGWDERSYGDDPLFTNPANDDYSLQIGSPAKGLGEDLPNGWDSPVKQWLASQVVSRSSLDDAGGVEV